MLINSVETYLPECLKGIISDGPICVIAVPQIFHLHQAVKIFNNCAIGLYSIMRFLNLCCENGCPQVGWISSCLEQPHLSYCFALLQIGWNSSEHNWTLIKAFGNPIMFPINQNKLGSCSFISSHCTVYPVWNGRKSSMDWLFWQGNKTTQVTRLGNGKAAVRG